MNATVKKVPDVARGSKLHASIVPAARIKTRIKELMKATRKMI